jgi:hypothetical protein
MSAVLSLIAGYYRRFPAIIAVMSAVVALLSQRCDIGCYRRCMLLSLADADASALRALLT